ncbi:MAG: site-2 protease family protein [bacterium]|nr:site-2 protease family protein [bacterium]
MDSVQVVLILVCLPGAIIATLIPKYLQSRLAYWLANRGSSSEAVYPWESEEGRESKRLSLNPFVHFDLLGTALGALARVGWGRELRLKPDAFERSVLHTAIVALYGPALNLLLGILFTLMLVPVLGKIGGPPGAQLWHTFGAVAQESPLFRYLFLIIFASAFINFRVAIFNLLPLPPLDFGQVLRAILPVKIREKLDGVTRYTSYVILAFLLLVMMLGWRWFEVVISVPAVYIFGLTGYDGWELLGLFGVLLKLPL